MLQNFIGSALVLMFSCAFVIAQTEPIKPSVISGDVASIADKKIVVNAKSGAVDAVLTEKTEFKRVSPVNPSLAGATVAALTDIGVGDKVIVTGIMAADGKSIPARAVYLMTKAEISQKAAREAAEWRSRGVFGKVTATNPQTNQVTIEVRGLMGAPTSVVITPKDKATIKRYAPDSVKFSEAKESSIAEIKTGDMVRALGDRNSDGTSFAAEQILSGAFQTVAGTVKSIDVEKNEVVVSDIQTKKDLTVIIGETSVLKKFPTEMAERMAMMQTGGGGEGGARPVRPAGAAPPGPPAGAQPAPGQRTMAGGPGGMRSGGGGLDDMFERLPAIKAADLKVGDQIAFSSTKNGSADRIKAIKLVAGVEPFLRMASAAAAGGRRGGGVEFNIPGLDGGIGVP